MQPSIVYLKNFLVYLLLEFCLGNAFAPEVNIAQGMLRGAFRQTWKGKTFSAFTGIPYALPPVGNLRFEAPVAAKPWKGILDATKLHTKCTQIDVLIGSYTPEGDEDCLYINVYTPAKTAFKGYTLPVMVFIYGGGWTSGSGGPDVYGADYLLEEDVLLVVFNYRVGALGFLSTEDNIVPGNNGLKDQVLALKWINANIVHFGGNPKRVTIFGQSSGGASVGLHLLSPLSRGLFSGAIAQSGSPLASWAVANPGDMLKNAKKLAGHLNCPTNSITDMVKCLKNVKAYDIVKQDTKFYVISYDPMSPYQPVIEEERKGAFLTSDPMYLIKAGKVAPVPFMTGLTSEDGAVKTAAIFNERGQMERFNNDFDNLLPVITKYKHMSTRTINSVRYYYFNNKTIDENVIPEHIQFMTDYFIASPIDRLVRALSKYTKLQIYYYLFGFRGRFSFTSILGDSNYDCGVSHGDEFYYLLSRDLFKQFQPNNSEKAMRELMVSLWTNFAKFGNPTPNNTDNIPLKFYLLNLLKTSLNIPLKWSPATSEKGDYYLIKNHTNVIMDDVVFKTPPASREDLKNRIRNALRNMPRAEVKPLKLNRSFLRPDFIEQK